MACSASCDVIRVELIKSAYEQFHPLKSNGRMAILRYTGSSCSRCATPSSSSDGHYLIPEKERAILLQKEEKEERSC